jgi:hypothetical protein
MLSLLIKGVAFCFGPVVGEMAMFRQLSSWDTIPAMELRTGKRVLAALLSAIVPGSGQVLIVQCSRTTRVIIPR